MDGCITITENKEVRFIVNTGAGKIARKRQNGQNQISGKISKVHYLACERDVLESRDMGQIQFRPISRMAFELGLLFYHN